MSNITIPSARTVRERSPDEYYVRSVKLINESHYVRDVTIRSNGADINFKRVRILRLRVVTRIGEGDILWTTRDNFRRYISSETLAQHPTNFITQIVNQAYARQVATLLGPAAANFGQGFSRTGQTGNSQIDALLTQFNTQTNALRNIPSLNVPNEHPYDHMNMRQLQTEFERSQRSLRALMDQPGHGYPAPPNENLRARMDQPGHRHPDGSPLHLREASTTPKTVPTTPIASPTGSDNRQKQPY